MPADESFLPGSRAAAPHTSHLLESEPLSPATIATRPPPSSLDSRPSLTISPITTGESPIAKTTRTTTRREPRGQLHMGTSEDDATSGVSSPTSSGSAAASPSGITIERRKLQQRKALDWSNDTRAAPAVLTKPKPRPKSSSSPGTRNRKKKPPPRSLRRAASKATTPRSASPFETAASRAMDAVAAAAAAAEAKLCLACSAANAADTGCPLQAGHQGLCGECLVTENAAAGWRWARCRNPACEMPLPTPDDVTMIACARKVERGGEPSSEQAAEASRVLEDLRRRAEGGDAAAQLRLVSRESGVASCGLKHAA